MLDAMKFPTRRCIGVLLLATGCATVPARPAQRFTGQPYDVRDDYDRVSGVVCGASIDFIVDRRSGEVSLTAFNADNRPASFTLTHENNGRHIVGAFSGRTGGSEVDLFVDDAGMRGKAGVRRIELRANGDVYYGKLMALGTLGGVPAIVGGRAELTRLPDETLAAVLPTLLNCQAPGNSQTRGGLVVRIGGPPSFAPAWTNETPGSW
jgi:hypothetical protein